ncbi:P-loop containing nucleoside triphosphate hydrolase protein [Mycena vulgaris]|nr:P-loop containing nucleoside triphosphate hydrolase protein [Mycena vulgaris]
MTSPHSAKAAPNPPQMARATPSRLSKKNSQAGSSASGPDWLSPTILAARVIAAAGECLPFPYVKGAFGIMVIFLETVEKVTNNRDDLKELCDTAMEIMTILKDQIAMHKDTAAVKLKGLCEDFERFLRDMILGVETMQKKSESIRGHITEFLKSGSIQDMIARYQRNIQEICSRLKLMAVIDTNFQVHEIKAALATGTSSNISVMQGRRINNCPLSSRIFQGRQAILDKMSLFFNAGLKKQYIYVLHGLGGAGKTQISLKFIEDSSHFKDIFFLDASTEETIETGLKNIATMKNIGNSSQDALKWLANQDEDWLLFIDNADDPNINLNSFLPRCNHGNIVITSRNPGLCVYAGSHSQVSDMEETDAVPLLLKSAAQEISPANEPIAAEIVKVLCYLPLAIVQAGGFISQSGALGSYLDFYKRNRAQLLSEKPAQTHDDYVWTVYTTWQMSFDRLSPSAAMLLQLCSFLHREGISEETFSMAATYKFRQCIPSKEDLQKPLEFLSQFLNSTGEWDSLRFLKVTNELRAYSLISFAAERKLFSIHPLVHSWSQTTITEQHLYHSIMGAIVGMSFAEMPSEDQQLASLRLISHVDSLGHGNQQVAIDFSKQYTMIYYHVGRYEEAKDLAVAAIERETQLLGADHPDTLWAMGNLASTYFHLGKHHQAEELEAVVLAKRKQVLGDDHPETLCSISNLATIYRNLHNYHKAKELGVIALEKRKQVLGDAHPDTLLAMGELASIYRSLNKHTKAKEIKKLIRQIRKAS